MPLLVDAIRGSANESAAFRTTDGVTVLVKRVIGQDISDSEEGYAVSVQYDDSRPAETFDTDNLAAAMATLRSLGVAGFAPDSDQWQPADVNVDQWTHSA